MSFPESYFRSILTNTCNLKALARAIYARNSVIILDDVFSGMDAHTTDIVSSRLLGPKGLLRMIPTTVIIATHSRK